MPLHRTDLVGLKWWCFLVFSFFFLRWLQVQRKPWEQLGQKQLREDLAQSHLLRRRMGAKAEETSVYFIHWEGTLPFHLKWQKRKKCELWFAICLCWDVTHLPISNLMKPLMLRTPVLKFCQKICRLASDFWVWLNCHTDIACLLWLLKPEKTPKMKKTKADLHNENKVLTEYMLSE